MKNVIELTSLEAKTINGGTEPVHGVIDGGCTPPGFPFKFPTPYPLPTDEILY